MSIPKPDLAPDQFLRPLHLIWAEHERQLLIGKELVRLAAVPDIDPVIEIGGPLLAFFTEDLLLHHQDEEADLFRILRFICPPQDHIEPVLEELDRDHAVESYLMRSIVVDLKRVLGGKKLESAAFFFDSLNLFARDQERHLAWENEVVLPLASKRLSSDDLEELGRNMAARRRITLSTRIAT
jgi:hemerythrin-like domain-containing protein